MNKKTVSQNLKKSIKIYQDSNFQIIIGITLITILGGPGISPLLPSIAKDLNIQTDQGDQGTVSTISLLKKYFLQTKRDISQSIKGKILFLQTPSCAASATKNEHLTRKDYVDNKFIKNSGDFHLWYYDEDKNGQGPDVGSGSSDATIVIIEGTVAGNGWWRLELFCEFTFLDSGEEGLYFRIPKSGNADLYLSGFMIKSSEGDHNIIGDLGEERVVIADPKNPYIAKYSGFLYVPENAHGSFVVAAYMTEGSSATFHRRFMTLEKVSDENVSFNGQSPRNKKHELSL